MKNLTQSQLNIYVKKILQLDEMTATQIKNTVDFLNSQPLFEKVPPLFIYNLVQKIILESLILSQ